MELACGRMGEIRNAYRILVVNPIRKHPVGLACGRMGEIRNAYRILVVKPLRKHRVGITWILILWK